MNRPRLLLAGTSIAPTSLCGALVSALLVACSATSAPAARSSAITDGPQPGAGASIAPASGSAAPSPAPVACSATQFVACVSGQACATRAGVLVEPHTCFDHAQDACDALGCSPGCDIHGGAPNQVFCSADARYSSRMERCGGYSNWVCPENTRCEMPAHASSFDDAEGRCVPDAAAR